MRARSLKPGTFKNEVLGSADPLITILFAGLWCLADREGRLEDRPLRISGQLFPYRRSITEKRCHTMLQWLNDRGFIARYTVENSAFIQVLEFSKHQRPHSKEQPSIIPPLSSLQPLPRRGVGNGEPLPTHNQGDGEHALTPDSGLLTPHSSPLEIRPSPPSTPEPVEGADPPLARGRRANGTNPRALGTNPRAHRNQSLEAWRSVIGPIERVAATGTLPLDQRLTWTHVQQQLQADQTALAAIEAVGEGDFGHGCRLIADRDRFTQADLEARFRTAYERATPQAVAS